MNKPELRKRLHDLERRIHQLFEMTEEQIDAEFGKCFPAINQQEYTTMPLRSLVMFAVEQNFPISVRT